MKTLKLSVILRVDEEGNELVFKPEIDMRLLMMYVSDAKSSTRRIHQAAVYISAELKQGVESMLHAALQSNKATVIKHIGFLKSEDQ
jgi:hypothetical protein